MWAATARRLPPKDVGASHLNRDSFLTIGCVVHFDILGSVAKDGHDPELTKPAPCIHYTSPGKLALLLAHNQKITNNAPALMPSVHPPMAFGFLASTHYNTGLRCARDHMHSPAAGDLKELADKDDTFRDAVQHGHTWLVLPDSIPDNAARQISKWYNQEQNKNTCLDEVDILRMCIDVLDEYSAHHPGK